MDQDLAADPSLSLVALSGLPEQTRAVHSCGESAEHFGKMGARLEGGYSRPPVTVELEVPLCFEHAALTKDGLTVKSWTSPVLG